MGGRSIQKDILDQLIETKLNHFNNDGFAIVGINISAAIGALTKFNSLFKISFNTKLIKTSSYSLITVFVILGITEAVLFSVSASMEHKFQEIISLPEVSEAKELKSFIDLAKSADDSSHVAILDKLYEALDQRITLERILIDKDRNTFVSGIAVSETAIINFRDKLLKFSIFQDVVLPLANLEKGDSRQIKFSLSAIPKQF